MDHSLSREDSNNCDEGSSSKAYEEVEVPPLYPEEEKGPVKFKIAKEHFKYNLKPGHIDGRILYHNASDPEYYKRTLPNPTLVVWFLCSTEVPETYTLRRLWEVGWRKNIQVRFMIPSKFELIAGKGAMERLLYQGEEQPEPDCVIPRLGARGSTYFALAVLRNLEKQGLFVLNTSDALQVTRDKLYTTQVLAGCNVPIPKTIALTFPINTRMIEREFEFPIIMKLSSGSQGTGVMKVESCEQLIDMAEMLARDKSIILQEFVKFSSGRDVRAYVIGGKVVGAMVRTAESGFKANVHLGGHVSPLKLTPALEWLVLESVKLVGLDIAGVDLLFSPTGFKVCEVNSSPGIEGFERATKVNIPHLLFEYVKLRCGVRKVVGKQRTKDLPLTPESLDVDHD